MLFDILGKRDSTNDEEACRKIASVPVTPEMLVERNDFGATPLHVAVNYGFSETAELLINLGADIEITSTGAGYRPMHAAAMWDGSAEVMVPILVKYGANIDGKSDGSSKECTGMTPLILATSNNQIKSIEVLLDYGAKIDETDRFMCTAIYVAARKGNTESLSLLISRGGTLDSVDDRGNTPLMTAAYNGKIEAVKLLIEKGASIRHKNNANCGAIFMARFANHFVVYDHLKSVALSA